MTAAELIEQVRDEISDYGLIGDVASTALTATASASDTTLQVADSSLFEVGDWLSCENEICEVSEEVLSTTGVIPVRRGMRGTTAAIHNSGSVVRAGQLFSNVTILRVLNRSLAGAFPTLAKVVENETLYVIEGQREYDLSATLEDIYSVWIEDSISSASYSLTRLAVPVSQGVFMLYGTYEPGRKIRVIGITSFTALTLTGNLDTSYPTNGKALAYLVQDAIGQLMYMRATQLALNDQNSARGAQQGQDDRYVLLNTAKAIRLEAAKSLRAAKMQLPRRVHPRPDARYFS